MSLFGKAAVQLFLIAYGQHHLVCHETFIHQLQRQIFCHFLNDDLCFFCGIGALQHLTGTKAVVFRLIRFDLRNGAWLPAPGMINQQLSIDAKHAI